MSLRHLTHPGLAQPPILSCHKPASLRPRPDQDLDRDDDRSTPSVAGHSTSERALYCTSVSIGVLCPIHLLLHKRHEYASAEHINPNQLETPCMARGSLGKTWIPQYIVAYCQGPRPLIYISWLLRSSIDHAARHFAIMYCTAPELIYGST